MARASTKGLCAAMLTKVKKAGPAVRLMLRGQKMGGAG
jgi:hypothetical protein